VSEGSRDTNIKEVEFRCLPQLFSNRRVISVKVKAYQGILKNLVPSLNGFYIDTHVTAQLARAPNRKKLFVFGMLILLWNILQIYLPFLEYVPGYLFLQLFSVFCGRLTNKTSFKALQSGLLQSE